MANAKRLLKLSLMLGAVALLSACAGPGPYYADYGPGYGYDYGYGYGYYPGYYDYGPAVGFDFHNGHHDRDFRGGEHRAFVASAPSRSTESHSFARSGGGRESGGGHWQNR